MPELQRPKSRFASFHALKKEWFLGIGWGSSAIFWAWSGSLFRGMDNTAWLVGLFLFLFLMVLGCAVNVVRHAEHISKRLGEPYGTLVLTLSITAIEVMSISAVMMHGENNPTLVRDTLYSVVMIVLGGMVGLSLLVGAIFHREQTFNLQGANAYLGVIVPLAAFSLILPNLTHTTDGPTLSTGQQILVGGMSAALFATFLLIQTGRHRSYFAPPIDDEVIEAGEKPKLLPHVLLLICYMLPVVYLVEQLAVPIDYIVEALHPPHIVGGVVMAILVAAPEAIGGVKAAVQNRLQLSVNIFLGSVLATIGLSVPIMLIFSNIVGLELTLGLSGPDMLLLGTILAVSTITFSSGKTHLLQGVVHILLFVAFIMLAFDG
ncbi:Ca2+:H+ antiporter [Cohaesibacter sp. ES.047]|uniref:calcium:proton antiporter n=1 Tax=Cohaesibacter sp. ES.047 TaxID=1798205 RepID=UPI000BB87132|nr:calcium:proton antiporter [Cohaesibacter sp. ES.047]SNY93594.1 Ca2+:H+ antiporter [Cohaesibacter sp. ES.047]